MNPDRYLVVGNPVSHSLSPRIHSLFAEQLGHDIEYDKTEVPLDGFNEFADRFAAAGGKGLNVTVPFKGDAWAYVQSLDELARGAGAVNTISFSAEGSHGYNTDGIGLVSDLRQRHQQTLRGKHIVILGAGGASRGVMAPLLEQSPRQLTVVNRTVQKARDLCRAFTAQAGDITVAGVSYAESVPQVDVIINATSSALSGATLPVNPQWVAGAFCYDMSYGANAAFSRWAAARGAAHSVDGLGMLVEQAAAAFAIWRGAAPDTNPVYGHLRREIDRELS